MALTKESLILQPDFQNIPEELKQLPQWVVWKAEPNEDNPNKLDKHPYQTNGKKAATNRPNEWSTFQEIEKAFGTGEFDGIGFVFTEDDPYIGLDIDGEDLENLSTIALSLSTLSYTEKSPSGKGLHIIFKGKLPGGAINKKGNLEIYEKVRYFTFTGNVITDRPIIDKQQVIDAVINRHFGLREEIHAEVHNLSVDVKPLNMTNSELWEKMFKSQKGEVIRALFNGDSSYHSNDKSRADEALCYHLAFWTQKNPYQMDSMFRESKLYRENKWNKKHFSNGQTYGERTIENAIKNCKNVYNPQNDDFQIHLLMDKPQFKLCFSGIDVEISPGIKQYDSGIDLYEKWRACAKRANDWRADLEYIINDKKDTATVAKNARNVELILRNEIMDSLSLDEFSNKRMVIAPIPWRQTIEDMEEWKSQGNVDDSQLCHWFAVNWNIKDKETIFNALVHILQERTFHPVKEFIESVEWDGEIRVPTFFCDHLLAEHSQYTHEVTKRWFTGAVKRIYEPGCKFEILPVLTGPIGIGKSYLSSKLANDKWFTDSLKSVDPKVAGEILSEVWICEIGELTTFKNATVEDVKAFISSSNDRYRGAYDRGNASEHKRHSVFIGTTNEHDFIRDEVGERRLMPIKCHATKKTTKAYDITPETVAQIWAEAKFYYNEGYLTYIDPELQDLAEVIHEQHKDVDPLQDDVLEYAEGIHKSGRPHICLTEIWKCVVTDDVKKKPTPKDSKRIVAILTSLGYERTENKQRCGEYGVQRSYIKK